MKTQYKIRQKNINGQKTYFLFYDEQILERNILPNNLRPLIQDWLATNNWYVETINRTSRTVTYEIRLKT